MGFWGFGEWNNQTAFCGLWPEDIVLLPEEPPVLNPEDKLSLPTHSTWLDFTTPHLKASPPTTELVSLSTEPLPSLVRPSEENTFSAPTTSHTTVERNIRSSRAPMPTTATPPRPSEEEPQLPPRPFKVWHTPPQPRRLFSWEDLVDSMEEAEITSKVPLSETIVEMRKISYFAEWHDDTINIYIYVSSI